MKVNLVDFVEQGKCDIRECLEKYRQLANPGKPVTGNGSSIKYEASLRVQAIPHGGIGVVQKLVEKLGLARRIDDNVRLFKRHSPYFESDHVLNIAYNAICGGDCLEDIELRRQDAAHLRALNAVSIPDPTTAGDFCRRFDEVAIKKLMDTFNDTRIQLWKTQPKEFLREARIDLDGILVGTLGEKKQGMDISYKGIWGYHPLLVSLANTGEPLFLVNRPGNVPSHQGAAEYADKAIDLAKSGGFEKVILRGDTDFALTKNFDKWDSQGVDFFFGIDAMQALTELADFLPDEAYEELIRDKGIENCSKKTREKRENIKAKIVFERCFKNKKQVGESIGEFQYQPGACEKPYRVIVLRKEIEVSKGKTLLLPEVRYLFYITNNHKCSTQNVIYEANQRCNQENIGAQLKGGVHALKARLDNLESNWAYMVMVSLAWSLKAWLALYSVPIGKEEKRRQKQILSMEFKRFVNSVIFVPAQIVETARNTVFRLLTRYKPGVEILARLTMALDC